ncbi:MAG: Hpt domain-containing protein [Deltaproteobacteria bacterium]|nr:Hpt domain-containing protein [Deltaproteobacteria bacterium]
MAGSSEKIVIQADPEIANLIPGYLENRKKDIARMLEALGKGDYETINFIGHSMRGSGEGYGFSAISEIGTALEQAAKHNSTDEIRRRIDELAVYIGRVEVVYE